MKQPGVYRYGYSKRYLHKVKWAFRLIQQIARDQKKGN